MIFQFHRTFSECCCSHFEKNKNCPTCNRIMGENDFTELMVRAQNLEPKIIRQKARQPIFVKKRANSRFFRLPDMYYGLQRRHSVLKEGTKFVLRQFMKENNIQMKRSSQIRHALSAMKEDHDALKLESNKHKQKVETFKQELILANEKLNEKDRQLNQFRKMIGSKNGAPSSRGDNTGRDHHGGTTAKRPRRVSGEHQFVRPSTRHGHETSRPRGHSQDRSNPYSTQPQGGNRPSAQPRGNPFNGDFPPSSQERNSHRNRSSKNPYREQQPHRPPPSRSHSVGTRSANSGGRIRNITASTPYAFSGSVAEGRSKLSPSQFYASKAPRRHHSQSY